MTNYGIQLSIGGLQPPATWDGSPVLALDSVKIDWGRESVYDDTDPGTMRLDVLDRDGQWFTAQTRIGEAVTVTRTGGAGDFVLFRGQVTDLTAERRQVINPQNDREESVWIAHLTVQDKLGIAGSTVPAGPMGANSYEGSGGWGESGPTGRMNQLQDQGALSMFTGGHTFPPVDPVLPSNVNTVLHGIKAKDAPSLLELMLTAVRCRAGSGLEYDPNSDSVGRSVLVVGGGVRLVRSGNVVSLVGVGATRVVPAVAIGTPDGYDLSQSVTDAIDTVTVTGFYYGKDTLNSDGSIEYGETSTTGNVGATSSRNLTVDSQLMSYDPSLFTAGSRDAYNRGKPWLVSALVALAQRLNGWMQYPTLEVDQRRRPLPDAIADAVLRTTASPVSFYFAGSVFLDLQNVPSEVQMIGGTLAWEDGGWTQRPNLIPSAPAAAGNLTNSQLFAASTATWAMFNQDVTWADFGSVTQGLTS